ncbi:MAG: hypothetical protein NT062_09150 [Proteobacteria bacterium]|nr:hypothetical protein [Pseudomonadota bacterium]
MFLLIACILAEPSADHPFADDLVVGKLTDFQHAMMTAIDTRDHVTPYFIGPAYNYDTMGYRWDAYATAFPEFAGRLIYEVNVLMPKPWIGDGTDGTTPVGYPILPAATSAALTATLLMPTGNLQVPLNDEKIFSKQRAANFAMLMSKPFLTWYLEFARNFAETHQVPMVVDQFGAAASDGAGLAVAGQLAYEQDVIGVVEAAGMGWSRWIYAVSSVQEQPRDILHNDAVKAFYQGIGAARSGP